ncbi:MAG: trypsin-like peptidase domain-containing protein [Halobacteria archaeon]|nr:trypsin-like peptidase domain-containing protein [Halobacteria archaeon]
MTDRRLVLPIIFAVILAGAVAGLVVQDVGPQPQHNPGSSTDAPGTSSQPGNGSTTSGMNPNSTSAEEQKQPTSDPGRFTEVYRETIDSIVSIRVTNSFGAVSLGSGFVYDSDGHIVTNQHVVEGANVIEVRFSNGEWRTAEVIGTDIYTDLAVLKVNNMPDYAEPLEVADTSPALGQQVVAIGNPLGLEGSITHGIISGLDRMMVTENNFVIPNVIQTDAPVNPGNSGGPIVTLDGKVVGVIRAKEGDNIGFAISPALVQKVVPSLIDDGDHDHAFMGITTIEVTPTVAEANGLENVTGVLVVDVLEDGPSKGVLEPSNSNETVDNIQVPTGGDVIIAINGTRIASQEELASYLMTRTSPGDTIEVTVIRDGEVTTVEVTLGKRPEP